MYVNALIARDRDTDANGSLDERLYPTQDANWNVTSIVNTSGTVQERFSYDAYGKQQVYDASWTSTTDSKAWRQGFQGGFNDTVLTNLILFENRVYNTDTMRWVQEDPLGTAYQDGMNLSQFVMGNPGAGTDPAGEQDLSQYGSPGQVITGPDGHQYIFHGPDSPYAGDQGHWVPFNREAEKKRNGTWTSPEQDAIYDAQAWVSALEFALGLLPGGDAADAALNQGDTKKAIKSAIWDAATWGLALGSGYGLGKIFKAFGAAEAAAEAARAANAAGDVSSTISKAAKDAIRSGDAAARDAMSEAERAAEADKYRQIGDLNKNFRTPYVKDYNYARARWLEGKGPYPGSYNDFVKNLGN